MTPASDPVVAQGATHYRRRGLLERLAGLARARVGSPIRWRLKPIYHAALRLQTGGRGFECRLPGGEVVRVSPEWAHLAWNPDEYQAFRAVVRPGMVALDVGANAGAYALALGRWVGPTGRVFAFEPAPALFVALSEHIRLNDLEAVVTAVDTAASDREGTASLVVADTFGESRLAVHGTSGGSTAIDVETTTIDAFCARHAIAPDFIKIDVEGAELSVLRGARHTIRTRGRALALFVEMHPTIWRTMNLSPDAVLAGIRELGLEPERPWAEVLAVEGFCARLVSGGPS